MADARLVVVEGPDVGNAFPIPPGGGAVGRGDGSAIQLADPAVSRHHFTIEEDGERHVLVDAGSKNRTIVNRAPVERHPLTDGDEISVGTTRLVYLPREGGLAVVPSTPGRLTIEIPTRELAALRLGEVGGGREPRARRHLAALAGLGEGLRGATDRVAAATAVCEALRQATQADRAFVLAADGGTRLTPVAASVRTGDPAGTQVTLPEDALKKALDETKAFLLAPAATGGRTALVAPLSGAPGIVVVDRATAPGTGEARRALPGEGRSPLEDAWGEDDVLFAACVAALTGAALASLAARDVLAAENKVLEERLGGPRELVGEGGAARALKAFIAKVGPTDSTVLLLGESGAGKEVVASAIHRASRRVKGPFVAVNCAALTETLLESELFGHEKGAFTGATERKAGRFELADGGTLFLDEVGELPLKCQTKFLRVLEERRFERVGGQKVLSTDVRVIAATNRDLAQMVRDGTFREDLFYRLSVIQGDVLPLRARLEDVPALAEHLLGRVRRDVGRRVTGFTPEAMAAMQSYRWPGNVRELRNAIERAVVLGEGDRVRREDLPPQIAGITITVAPAASTSAPSLPEAPAFASPAPEPASPPAPRSLRELEKEGIIAALAATNGNKAQAAAVLEIDRSTLYKKLKDYGIEG